MVLFELSYSSISSTETDGGRITDILEVSRAYNAENDISGCLFYHNNQYTQILEGDKGVIQELYSRILRDKRHYNVKLLYEGEKDERIFESWSMAFLELHSEQSVIDIKLFEENLYFFSEFTEQSTLAVNLFWEKVRQIIKK